MSVKAKNQQSNILLIEAKKYHDLRLGVHWLRPGSKAPVKFGWNSPKRDDWETLLREYRDGYGLGVRLGAPSKLDGGYLAVIDVDLRSLDPRHVAEAYAVVDRCFPGLRETAPCVKTGRGFHFYTLTEKPMQSSKVETSDEEVKVYSPTTPISDRQRGKLTPEDLKAGHRMKAAWEVEFMSSGRQVVLPPTRHPDTKAQYEWVREF